MPNCHRKDKRRRIIEAAVAVFSREGFYGAKVEEIAVQAGVGKGTVYEYFKSKKDLFRQMLVDVTERYLGALHDSVASPGKVRDQIEALLATSLKFILEHRDMAQVIMAESPPLGDDLRQWARKRREAEVGYLEGLIARGIEEGELRPVQPRQAALLTLGALMISCGEAAEGHIDVDEWVSGLLDLLFRGMQNG